MMRKLLFIGAVACSLGVHVVLAGLNPPRASAPAGGDMAGEVALGSSFDDLAAGVLESTRAEGQATQPAAETLETAEPELSPPTPAETTDQAELETQDPTQTEARASPTRDAAVQPNPVAVPPSAAVPLTSAVSDVAVLAPVEPIETPDLEEPPEATRSEPLAQATAPAEPQETSPTTETLSPVEARETIQVAVSPRPVLRPPQRTETARDTPAPAAPPARRGNTEVNAARGQSSGSEAGQQAQSNRAQQTTARRAGQAEVNSYNANVAARVARAASRLRSGGNRGDVRVGITIAASGGLSGVSVISSSGNGRADSLALEAVRRAAPFGPPPQGSTRLRVTVQLRR